MSLDEYIRDLKSDVKTLEKSTEIYEWNNPHSFELSQMKRELEEKKSLLKWLTELKAYRKAKVEISKNEKTYRYPYSFGFSKSIEIIDKYKDKETKS